MLRFPKVVWFLALGAFFTDLASDAIHPILPFFLQSLGAGIVFIGFFEGLVETFVSLTKFMAGYQSDRLRNREVFVVTGYSISTFFRPILALTTGPIQVLVLRVMDRIGKGIRTAPRDAILTDHSTEATRGRTFAFHRALDHAGATIAPILASIFLFIYPESYRTLFALTLIPGLIAVFCVWKAVKIHRKQKLQKEQPVSKEKISLSSMKKFPRELFVFLGILFLFTLSQSSDAFLLLKLKDFGVPEFWIPTLWAGLSGMKLLSSFYGGALSDRAGPRKAILLGWTFYGLMYVLFAFADSSAVFILLFLIYGLYYGLTESPEKALVSFAVRSELRGSAFGAYHLTVGLGSLPASLIFGWIWYEFSPAAAFMTSSAFAVIAALSFGLFSFRGRASVR